MAINLMRLVTSAIKRQVWPLVEEWGFDDRTGRTATRIQGPITAVIAVQSLSARHSEVMGIPTSSFFADVGVDVTSAQPSSFFADLAPAVPDIAQTRIRASLSKNRYEPGAQRLASHERARPDVWVVEDADTVEDAVSDLRQSVEQQGGPFLAQWSDLDVAHHLLAHGEDRPGALGIAAITYPGRPGSISRLTHLAAMAALRNDPVAERKHLEALLEHGPDPRVERRLAQIG